MSTATPDDIIRSLRAENRRLAAMLDALPDHLMMQDLDARIVFANRSSGEQAGAVLGLPREQIVGHSVLDGPQPPAFKEYALGLVARACRGETFSEEFAIPGPDGPQWRETHVAPVYGPDGEVEAVAMASRDIQRRKQAEAQVAEDLAFRERVMGILGHDLRNPLAVVLSVSKILARRADMPERALEGLGHIRRSAERMEQMINTILDFTQLRFRGLPPLARQSFDLETLTRAVVDELQLAHPDREVHVTARGDLRGRWDYTRLGQVIANLVGNALTHGAVDTPVTVDLSGEDGRVTVAVGNRGATIPANAIAHLFEPFWQASADHRSRGLGLGLFIAQQIVEAHGGSIDVRSFDEQTTFTVELRSDR
jgi:PAS domain S-box-containing protein